MASDKDPVILVVDDEERNIRLIQAMLGPENLSLVTALNGEEALQRLKEIRPDLILLDVMMPGMDGFEVCRRIKADEMNQAIPVLMVTALTEKEDRIKAMEAGADDFLNKPINKTELTIRVKSLLRIKSYHEQVESHLHEIKAKNKKLSELEEFKEELMHMIIHDLNIPLTGIIGGLDLVLMDREQLSDENAEWISDALNQAQYLVGMVRNILDISKLEEGKLQPAKKLTDMEQLTNEVLSMLKGKIDGKRIRIHVAKPDAPPPVHLDADMIKRVIANLMDNAIRHTGGGQEIAINLHCLPGDKEFCCSIRDSGQGLKPEFHEIIFDKYEQVQNRQGGATAGRSGLGLVFCRMAVEAHGGRIWVESREGVEGTTFCFTLPVGHSTRIDWEYHEAKNCTGY